MNPMNALIVIAGPLRELVRGYNKRSAIRELVDVAEALDAGEALDLRELLTLLNHSTNSMPAEIRQEVLALCVQIYEDRERRVLSLDRAIEERLS